MCCVPIGRQEDIPKHITSHRTFYETYINMKSAIVNGWDTVYFVNEKNYFYKVHSDIHDSWTMGKNLQNVNIL